MVDDIIKSNPKSRQKVPFNRNTSLNSNLSEDQRDTEKKKKKKKRFEYGFHTLIYLFKKVNFRVQFLFKWSCWGLVCLPFWTS